MNRRDGDSRVDDGRYRLELYVLGSSPRTAIAQENLAAICNQYLGGNVSLEVIDVEEDPERAEAERILATPTLVKRAPGPVHRIIGDLSATDKVLVGLGLKRSQSWTSLRQRS